MERRSRSARLRRQRGRLHRPGDRRRAGAADVASGRRRVQAFTPDGKAVLFTSQRASFTNRYSQLFTVPVGGGMEEQLPIPNAAAATYSPDGQRIAYNPIPPRFQQWKAVSRRHRVGDLALQHEGPRGRGDPAAEGPRERRQPDVDRRHGLLPLRPRRRVQHLRVRHEVEGRCGRSRGTRISR